MRTAYYRHQESVTEARREDESNCCWRLENAPQGPLFSLPFKGTFQHREQSEKTEVSARYYTCSNFAFKICWFYFLIDNFCATYSIILKLLLYLPQIPPPVSHEHYGVWTNRCPLSHKPHQTASSCDWAGNVFIYFYCWVSFGFFQTLYWYFKWFWWLNCARTNTLRITYC